MNILITGARSGIASHVINKILNKDYNIYVTVRNNEQLKSVKEKYKENKNVICLKLDMNNLEDIEKISSLDIDILYCNAAIGYGGSIITLPIEKLKENYEINVFNNFYLIKLILKNMIKKGHGKIIIMSSIAGIIPISFLGSYCSTKSSIITLSKCLKKELKILKKDIKIVLILPGIYKTGFNDVMLENKYNLLNDSIFNEEINLIRAKENIMFKLFGSNNFETIANKIYKAIDKEKPKSIYTSPMYQYILAKLIQLFI